MKNIFAKTRSQKLNRLNTLRDRFDRDVPESAFRYDRYVSQYSAEKKCGTICCIAGWLPLVFPKVFKWLQVGREFIVKIHHMPTVGFPKQIQRFFGIDNNIYGYLFQGKALVNLEGRTLYPAVRNMRHFTKNAATRRIDNVIELIQSGTI